MILMAKRKGKSRRRLGDWRESFVAGESQDALSDKEKFSPRSVKLPAGRAETAAENLESLPKREGMVIGLFARGALVESEGQRLLCGIAKTFRASPDTSPLAVGDEVSVAITPPRHASGQQKDMTRADGMILFRAPRRTALSRPQPISGKRQDRYTTEVFEKVLAANMDAILIVASTRQPPLRHGLIDRLLIIAERGGLQPVLAINKIDLGDADEQVLEDFAHLNVKIFMVSAATKEGISSLKDALAAKRTVLAGQSGVGKSSLVNAIVPGAEAATGSVRTKDQRGRHTTSATKIYHLDGGMIVDTPGVREAGINLQASELPWFFPEFEPFAAQCKFRDCTHTHEPACAVRLAVEEGLLYPRRYESYLRILQTLEE